MDPVAHEHYSDPHHSAYGRTVFGFWIYLLTDFILFGTLFATYAVLHRSTYGGPSADQLFDLSSVLQRTLVLLTAAFTAGLAGTAVHRHNKRLTLTFFGVTFLLGLLFLGMQIREFQCLLNGNHGWEKSAFLSAYFTLLGTFILHLIFALLWVFVLVIPVCLNGFTGAEIRRLTCLKMFWQFLNIVWIFIFSFVYLMGVK